MYAIYLVDRLYNNTGYMGIAKKSKGIANGEEFSYNDPSLSETPVTSYKSIVNAENRCRRLPMLLKYFCSDGSRYGWEWRNIYDIYIVDLEDNSMRKVIDADIKDKSLIHEDVRLGLHGYY